MDYSTHIHYSTHWRFDEFLPGVAVAMLKNFHRPIWERISRYGAYHIALWSYSIYLCHKAMAFIVNSLLAHWTLPAGVEPLIIACASLAAGWLLYRFVEAPFMSIRARQFPTSFARIKPLRRSPPVPVNFSQ